MLMNWREGAVKDEEKVKEGINQKGQSFKRSVGWEYISSCKIRREGQEMYSKGGRNLTPKVKKGCTESLRSRVRIRIATVGEKTKLKIV